MNYLSHARGHLDDAYALAGTALPDWLRVLGRTHRLAPSTFPNEAARRDMSRSDQALLIGATQHFHDDAWFHAAPAFAHVTGLLTKRIRTTYPDPVGASRSRHIRASFFGHILMELLLDGCLIEAHPPSVDRYYEALEEIDARSVAALAEQLLQRPIPKLPALIEGFRRYPFLRTYVDDREIAARLDQVAGRVRLPSLPDDFHRVVTWSRDVVREHAEALLTEPAT